jgi:transcriptional regulator with XRE-family HTH domain
VPKRKPPAEVPFSQREIFGENLRLAREQQGILQKDLAASVSISRAYLSQIESGVRNTNLDLAFALAAAVGKSIDELLEPPPKSPSAR